MTGDTRAQLACPRCGTELPSYARHCHRCQLQLEPGVAYFEPDSVDGAPAHAPRDTQAEIAYERKAIACLPMDLERIARAEAVDGWQLLDTTVDPNVAGNIIAHFRRPERRAGTETPSGPSDSGGDAARTKERRSSPQTRRRGAGGAPPPKGDPGPSETKRRRRKVKPAPEPSPRPAAKPAGRSQNDMRYMIYVVVVLIAAIWMMRVMGIWGVFIALFILPGIIRSILGVPENRKRRRRRNRRRR